MRSINTGLVALLPVGGLLFIGAGLLGAGTLKDLGLVLFVGMGVAVYSSIFFATPVLVELKEPEPRLQAHKQRVLAARAALAKAGGDPGDPPVDSDGVPIGGAGRQARRSAPSSPARHRAPGARPGGPARAGASARVPVAGPAVAAAGAEAAPSGRTPARASLIAAAPVPPLLPGGSLGGRSPNWSRARSSTCPTSRSRASCSRT